MDLLASFKVSSPSFVATEKVLSQTVVAALTISSSSSLLEKGLWRWWLSPLSLVLPWVQWLNELVREMYIKRVL